MPESQEDDKEPLALLSREEKAYGSDGYSSHLLEQYKVYAQRIEGHENRIETNNRFFVGVHIAICSGLFVMLQQEVKIVHWQLPALSALGFLLCLIWWLVLRSADKLNVAKHEVLEEMEYYLPLRPFKYEWCNKLESGKKYRRIKLIYQYVPLFFSVFYLGNIIVLIVDLLLRPAT